MLTRLYIERKDQHHFLVLNTCGFGCSSIKNPAILESIEYKKIKLGF
jgi:hypothetical protein